MAVSLLFSFLPLVIIVFVIAGVVGSKKGSEDHPERGKKMIKTVYVYLVLFATLMMTIGGTVAAFMAIADIVSPPAYSSPIEVFRAPDGTQTTPAQNLSEGEQKAKQDKLIAEQKAQTRERGVNSLIKSFGWIVIPLPIFIYFQRRVKDQPVA